VTTAEGDPVEERRSTGGDVRGPGGFWVWVVCAVGGLLIVGGVALVLSWQEYREQRRGAERVEVYALAVAVTARLTDERAALTGLLHDAPLPADLTGAGRARLRARTDAAITRLAASCAPRDRPTRRPCGRGRAALAPSAATSTTSGPAPGASATPVRWRCHLRTSRCCSARRTPPRRFTS